MSYDDLKKHSVSDCELKEKRHFLTLKKYNASDLG